MTKIGIIGSGDIAQKAYLPIISRRDVDLHLFARNSNAASNIAREYGIKNIHRTIDSLIDAGVEGAFVHTSTASHYEILKKLLSHGIHVYVDKPVTYDYASTKEIFELANAHNARLKGRFQSTICACVQKSEAVGECQHDRNAKEPKGITR
jgi:virulence factor